MNKIKVYLANAIPLKGGKETLVSLEDYPALSQRKWYLNNGYVSRNISQVDGKQSSEYMARDIMQPRNKHEHVDHIDHNTLNNHRINLRIVTPQQNSTNTRSHKDNSLGCRGVVLQKGKYVARIGTDREYLGSFDNPWDAMVAYDKAAIARWGKYASTNAEALWIGTNYFRFTEGKNHEVICVRREYDTDNIGKYAIDLSTTVTYSIGITPSMLKDLLDWNIKRLSK